jgi:hypothetical protein
MGEEAEVKKRLPRTIFILVKITNFKKVDTDPLAYVAENSLKHTITAHIEKFDTAQHDIHYRSRSRIDTKITYSYDGIEPGFFCHQHEPGWLGFIYRCLCKFEFCCNGKKSINLSI